MEARYVKVASRYFIVGNGNAGDGCGGGGDHRRRHFLDACFLCKRDITPGRHIFMYKYARCSPTIDRSVCIIL